MDLYENIMFGLTIGLSTFIFIFPGTLVTFIFSVILLILVFLYLKRSDKNDK